MTDRTFQLYRLEVVQRWPDGPEKEAVLRSIQQWIADLDADQEWRVRVLKDQPK